MTRVWRRRLGVVCLGALAVSLTMPEDAFAGRRKGHGSFGSSGGFGGSGGFVGGGSFGSVGGGLGSSGGSRGGLFGGRRKGKRARGFGSSGGGFGSSGGGFGSSGGGWGSSGGGWGSSGGGFGSSGGGMYVPHGGEVGPGMDAGPDGPPPPPPVEREARRYYNQPRPSNQVATIEVKVPANAKVYLQDQSMSLTGPVRRFVSPELEADRTYRYNVRVEVEHNGETISKTTQADVRAGQRVEVAVSFAEDKTDKLVSNVRLASSR
jgi:uncharacterized protein (TIGR03000 family)